MSDGEESPPDKEAVGYGRPPVASRFKKGRSGNPRGRPRRNQDAAALNASIGEIILLESYRTIEVRENDQLVKMPLIRAVIRSLGVAAVKGSLKAQLAIASMVETVERRNTDERNLLLETAIEYRRSWEEVFAECDRCGEPRPEPVPHPHEMQFDARTGAILFNGPKDELEAATWDRAIELRAELATELADYGRRMKRAKDDEVRARYERMIAANQDQIDRYDSVFPNKETRRAPGFHLEQWRERQTRLAEMKRAWRERKLAKGE